MGSDERTVGDLLVECLRALGARRVFGDPLPAGIDASALGHVPVGEPTLARSLADADGRIGPGPGVAWDATTATIRLGSQPGIAIDPWVIDDPGRLPGALGTWTIGEVFAASEYRLDVDLAAPVPDELESVLLDTPVSMYTLSPSLAELRTIVLAGPGVVREGQVPALQAFAAQAGVGVLNTWGAKGVFRWDSPFHLGTAGLQARDFELAGFEEAELIVAVGLDDDEVPRERWDTGPAQVLDVDPASLASLAFGWDPPDRQPERPRLYTELSGALGPHYQSDDVPLRPARAAGDLSAACPPGTLVAADAGRAGLWVARAFPTTEPGSVIVPARRCRGFAASAALVAGLDRRQAIAVVADEVDEVSAALLALAEALAVPVVVEVWDPEAATVSPEQRTTRLAEAWANRGQHVLPVPVDFSHTQVLTDVAGPVVAWGGPEGEAGAG